jgi:hypothetical protein
VTATKKKPDAFASMLAALQAVYEEEAHRLADVYRSRILAGEFSGDEPNDGPNYLRLERELAETHPWLATPRGRLAAEAASRWLVVRETAMSGHLSELEYQPGDIAAECMAHDILSLAAARGWVKRMRSIDDDDTYALRVA